VSDLSRGEEIRARIAETRGRKPGEGDGREPRGKREGE
jgi:hypothetical protein